MALSSMTGHWAGQAFVEGKSHFWLSAGSLELDVTALKVGSNILKAAEPFEILVNDAGSNRPKFMLEVSVEDVDAIMTLSVRSAFFVVQAAVKRLLSAKMTIVNMPVAIVIGEGGTSRQARRRPLIIAYEKFLSDVPSGFPDMVVGVIDYQRTR
jgi:NAD(P)-dependent dehydrogenase (short-subunit alcohol dehydrogenase family)